MFGNVKLGLKCKMQNNKFKM